MKFETVAWKGREVRYRPGRLYVCCKLRESPESCEKNILFFVEKTSIRNFYKPGLFELNVEPSLTLKLADDMIRSQKFRFIELEREGYF